MVDVVLISHGPLAQAMVETVELILASNSSVKTTCLVHGDDVEEFSNRVSELVIGSDRDEVLVFTDLFGGTPNNEVAKLIFNNKDKAIKCFTGMNLPTVLEAIALKDAMDLEALVAHLKESASESLFELGERLPL